MFCRLEPKQNCPAVRSRVLGMQFRSKHSGKQQFTEDEFEKALDRMSKHNIVPTGWLVNKRKK